jgi:undecaprenyl diphosphate synthase
MLDNIVRILPGKKKLLSHVAVSLEGRELDGEYLRKYRLSEPQLYAKKGQILQQISEAQVRLRIPVVTVFLLSSRRLEPGFSARAKHCEIVLDGLDLEFLQKNQVKVAPIGKWYELPSSSVELIKMLIDETKEYYRFFLNLCVYYDGQAEILDACKMIARRVEKLKLSPEDVTKETIAENLYGSKFMPPDIIILNDIPSIAGFLLWDSADSVLIITNAPWPEFSGDKFRSIVDAWARE